jgi:hypothetical protein
VRFVHHVEEAAAILDAHARRIRPLSGRHCNAQGSLDTAAGAPR